MKVLIVGSDYTWSIEKYFITHLTNLGVSIELFTAQNYFYAYYNKSICNKLKHRLGLSKIFIRINRLLITRVDEFQPDIVWVIKGMEINPSTLKLLKNKGIKLVNYNPDNPFVFSGYGSGNRNLTESITLFDLYLSYDSTIVQRLHSKRVNAAILPFGYELTEAAITAVKGVEEINKTCFIGNPDKERVDFLNQLAADNIMIDVYGHHWQDFKLHNNISHFEAVYQIDFWTTVRKYRVQLNLMRIHNLQSHNMRSFEIPAVGGILLAPATVDHMRFFAENKEAFFYTDKNDCVEKIKAILALDKDNVQMLREAARQASVNKRYSYYDRSQQLLNYFNNLIHVAA